MSAIPNPQTAEWLVGDLIPQPAPDAISLAEIATSAAERVTGTPGGIRDSSGRLELNSASVEALRTVGLSITQACRIVIAREAKGGFARPEELAEIPGLPEPLRSSVIASVCVDPALAA